MRRSPCEAEAEDVGERVDPGDVWEAGSNGEEDLDGVRDVRWRWPRIHGDGAMGSCKKKRWRGEGHPEGAEKRERRDMARSGTTWREAALASSSGSAVDARGRRVCGEAVR